MSSESSESSPASAQGTPEGALSYRRGGRHWLTWGAVAYLAILVVVVGSLFLLSRAARDRLDQALGQRLAGVASTAAYLVDGDSLFFWIYEPGETLEFLWLVSRLEQIRLQNDLAEITLCDNEGRVLISAAGRLERGEFNVFWDLDRGAVQVANEGFLSVSKLYRTGEIFQKSAHAPILATDGRITGVLTVEGNADFFDSLATLQRWAWLTGVIVLAFLTAMGLFLFRLQKAMERTRAAIWRQENLAAMGRMTAGIAHEIRNPLGIIRGAAQHLDQRLQSAGIEDDITRYIPEEVDRLDRILRGYLTFGTDQNLELEPVDISGPVQRTVKVLAEELSASGVEVVVADLPPDCQVMGDAQRLQQVLLNLLLNARDAMPNGGTVTIGLQCDRDQAVLSVSDEGTGLQGQQVEKLFAPFWTDKEKGSGLGLALARSIIENWGGTLRLADRSDGPGAVAEVRLPLRN